MASLILTPELVQAAYFALTKVRSVAKLNLPDEDTLIFDVIKTTDRFGDYEWTGKHNVIRVSSGSVGSWLKLSEVVAHEQIHAAGRLMGVKDYGTHGAWFKHLAKPICLECGFDLKAF